MGKNYLDNCHSITNTKDLTMKQMFDISAKLVSEQDEIYGVSTMNLGWFKTSQEYRNIDRIDREPMEFEWNMFPGFTTLQLSQEELYSCRCLTTSHG